MAIDADAPDWRQSDHDQKRRNRDTKGRFAIDASSAVAAGQRRIFTLNEPPKGHDNLRKRLHALRRALEAAVLDVRSEVSLVDAGRIQTAIRLEQAAGLIAHWLRNAGDLSATDKAVLVAKIGQLSEQRDKVIEKLKLDHRTDSFASIYDVPAFTDCRTTQSDATASPRPNPSDGENVDSRDFNPRKSEV